MYDSLKEEKVFNNSTRLVRIGGEMDLALKNFNENKTDKYKSLVQGIQSEYESKKSDQLILHLEDAKNVSNILEKKHKDLVTALVKIQLINHNEELWRRYKDFVMTLVTSSPVHLFNVIKLLFEKFTKEYPELQEEEDEDLKNVEQNHQRVCSFLHEILAEISRTFPESLKMMEKAVDDCFPRFKQDTIHLKNYTENILLVVQYQFKLREKVLSAIVEKMCTLDSNSSKEEIEKCEEDDSDDEDEEEEYTENMKHQQANSLDVLMELCFNFFYQTCHDEKGNLNSGKADKLFGEVIKIFFSKILHLHKSHHVQFLMFYLCSFDKRFVNSFLRKLWEKLLDFNTTSDMRGNCACYISSFLSRAKFVDTDTVKRYLQLMSNEALQKLANYHSNDLSSTVANRTKYRTFYLLCQALFYTVLFRLQSFIPDGIMFLKRLPMNQLITSNLNPLKSCFSRLVDLFSYHMKERQILYAEPIVKQNKRERIPVTGESKDPSNPLNSIFPFDEYILKRSKKYVEGDWLGWWDIKDDEEEDDEEDENMEVALADETTFTYSQLNEDI